MNTLELFLANAGGEHVEATHQRILAWLLGSETVVKGLLGLEVKNPTTKLEAHGRLFDIQINDAGGERALIEVKMWAPLRITQQKRQQEKALELGKPLYYFLFGISGFERVPDGNSVTLTMKEVADKFIKLKPLAKEIGKELNGISSENIASILDTYANRLNKLYKCLTEEAWKTSYKKNTTKASHYASLFYHLKKRIENAPSNQLTASIYRTEKGKNVTLEINHLTKSGIAAERSIQIADTKGQLIFWIKNEHLEIFFNPTPKDAKVSPAKTIQIRDAFNIHWFPLTTRLPSGKKLRQTGKNGTKWVCLFRVNLFTEAIDKLEALEKTVDTLKDFYDAFLKVKSLVK